MVFRNLPQSLTIPGDAGPGDSRIVVGGDVPAPLDTYLLKDHSGPTDSSVIGGIFFYAADAADDTYTFIVLAVSSNEDVIIHTGAVVEGIVRETVAGYPHGYQLVATLGGLVFLKMFTSANPRIQIGHIDTNLYRSAANTLKTDDSFIVGGTDSYEGATGWNTYTPTVVNGGTATFSVQSGRWKRISEKTIALDIQLTVNAAGSGASAVGVHAPTDIQRNIRTVFPADVENAGLTYPRGLTLTGGSGTLIDRIRHSASTNLTGADLTAGRIITIGGIYEEA